MELKEYLIKSKNLIETHGWIQYSCGDFDGGFCIHGAMDELRSKGEDGALNQVDCDAFGHLTKLANENIIQWNDAPGRTKEEVLNLFDKAIESL